MKSLLEQIDYAFSGIAWNLWNTLGVAGESSQHQDCLIDLEALILLTSIIRESDPRLFEEALDWCSKFHHFVSVVRLKTLINVLGTKIHTPYSIFAATLNSISQSKWPVFDKVSPLRLIPSKKSRAPNCNIPALLGLRVRALFGVGARADLATSFLIQTARTFTAADMTEIGYNKKTLVNILDDFVQSGLLASSTTRNQKQYELSKKMQLASLVGELPRIVPDWHSILVVFITLREAISKHQNHSISSKVVAISNAFEQLKKPLRKLNISPPQLPVDPAHWEAFIQQTGELVKSLALRGDFREITSSFEETFSSFMQKLYRVDDCVDGLEFIINLSTENPIKHQEIFKECYQMSICYLEELQSGLNDLLKFPIYLFMDIKLSEVMHRHLQENLQPFLIFVKNTPLPSTINNPGIALNWHRELEKELNKTHRFLHETKERLKELYFRKTNTHLLTNPPVLYKRHAVLKLFT